MKQVTITVPDNCELKQNGNTYTIVEKEKKLTYEDITKKLFPKGKHYYFIDSGGAILESFNENNLINLPNNTTSEKQAEKLLAINKLMNVAKYLNGDWQPDWEDGKCKYFIYYSNQNETLEINNNYGIQNNSVYFKSKELAKQAIEILGEETIKLALCTDY